MLKVSVQILIRPEDQDKGVWAKFFEEFTDVARIEWYGSNEGCDDVDVYFKDSDEVFPISSLRRDRPLRQRLEAIVGWDLGPVDEEFYARMDSGQWEVKG